MAESTEFVPVMARNRRQRVVLGEAADQAPAAPRLAFVPVELVGQLVATPSPPDDAPPAAEPELAAAPPALIPRLTEVEQGWGERTSLFGDLEG